jgi:hypothetical protein
VLPSKEEWHAKWEKWLTPTGGTWTDGLIWRIYIQKIVVFFLWRVLPNIKHGGDVNVVGDKAPPRECNCRAGCH